MINMQSSPPLQIPDIYVEQDSFPVLNLGNAYKSDEQQEKSEQSNEILVKKEQNSLSMLSKQFVELIKKKENMTIDLNEASQKLKVQKRRVYDIINVLEGIGYIERKQKNIIKWIGGTTDPQIKTQLSHLQNLTQTLIRQQQKLDQSINYISSRIKTDFQQTTQYNFIDTQDLDKLLDTYAKNTQNMLIIQPTVGGTISANQITQDGVVEIIINAKKVSLTQCRKITLQQSLLSSKRKNKKKQFSN